MELLQGQFLSPLSHEAAWGQNRVVKVEPPGEGNHWEATVPGGYCWSPVAIRFTLTTSAEAGSRVPAIFIESGSGTRLAEIGTSESTKESHTVTDTFLREFGNNRLNQNLSSTGTMPNLLIEQGWKIGDATVGLLAKDAFTNITLWVEEFEIAFDHTIQKAERAIRDAEELEEAFHG